MAEPLPATSKLTLYRGDTRVWTDVFTDGTEPYDLTGHTFVAEIRADRNRGSVVATIDCVVTDAAGGVVQRTLTSTEADKLGDDGTRLYWDLQSTDADGVVRTWLAGPVIVKGDATNV